MTTRKKVSGLKLSSIPAELVRANGHLTTPETERKTILLTEEELHTRLIELERQIQNHEEENVLAVDECGNVLIHLVGKRDCVVLPREYWDSAKVVTHNHPDGATLSETDISRLYDTNIEEIRACAGGVWYSVKREDEEDKNAAAVREELADYLAEVEQNCIIEICDRNGVDVEVDTETGMFYPIQPPGIEDKLFTDICNTSIREYKLLRVVRLHKALVSYAGMSNLCYRVGVLEP